jgi:hypothetical protein
MLGIIDLDLRHLEPGDLRQERPGLDFYADEATL